MRHCDRSDRFEAAGGQLQTFAEGRFRAPE